MVHISPLDTEFLEVIGSSCKFCSLASSFYLCTCLTRQAFHPSRRCDNRACLTESSAWHQAFPMSQKEGKSVLSLKYSFSFKVIQFFNQQVSLQHVYMFSVFTTPNKSKVGVLCSRRGLFASDYHIPTFSVTPVRFRVPSLPRDTQRISDHRL